MDREELITNVKLVYTLCDVSWAENDIFCLSDDKIDEKFRDWLNENEKTTYLEFIDILESSNNSLTDTFSIFDFFEFSTDKSDEELIEIYVNFILEHESLKEELIDNILDYLELNQEEDYDDDYYDDDYDELKEDRYDDYDYYDDYN